MLTGLLTEILNLGEFKNRLKMRMCFIDKGSEIQHEHQNQLTEHMFEISTYPRYFNTLKL